jgi:hypothetical protein
MDTNVDNYTIDELMAILNLDDINNEQAIVTTTNLYIGKFTEEGNQTMALFFQNMQDVLLNYSSTQNIKGKNKDTNQQTSQWLKNEYLQQTNKVQSSKVTDRRQKAELYNDPNNHILMKQEELGVANNFNVPVVQDVLNPNLKNITERFVNLDSQYRQNGMPASDYTLDLSDHLNDVISLRLYSFQIPSTWYLIDYTYGNTCFWITEEEYNILIEIAPGNYDSTTLTAAINARIKTQHFTNPTDPSWNPVSYNSINGKITINMFGAVYKGPSPDDSTMIINFTVTTNSFLTFFDYTGQLKGTQNPCVNVSQTHFVNQTLGWIMGYRLPYESVVDPSLNVRGNEAVAVLDLNGPRYFILVIDDLNRNHLNNGLVSITELSKTLKMPNYYSPDLPYFCVPQNLYATNLQANIQGTGTIQDLGLGPCNQLNAGDLLLEKLNNNLMSYPQLVPSAPRTLTQPQLYTINEIIKNNERSTNYRAKAPTTTDVFAVIPVKGGLTFGSLYVDFGGSLQSFKRNYFGPVNIDRLQISLLDDHGNVLNLNGADWSVTLIAEILYQY